MTVKELITALEKFPADLEIIVRADEYGPLQSVESGTRSGAPVVYLEGE